MTKRRLAFKFFTQVPVIRDTGDPEYAGILLLFAGTVVAGLVLMGTHDYTHVLQTAGGALVLLGLYFTGVNLRSARAEQYAARLISAIAHLASDSEAVRVATIRLLEAMLLEAPNVLSEEHARVTSYKQAVREALAVICDEGDTYAASAARAVAANIRSRESGSA